MPYNQNIPQPNDQISVSQGQILQNFQSIFTAFTQNHQAFNIGTAGQHTMVQLTTQAAAPAFAGAPGFWASTAANNPIFLHKAAGTDINISEYVWNVPFGSTQGSTKLPSGLTLKWGQATRNGIVAIPFTVPFAAVPYAAFVTPLDINFPRQQNATVATFSAASITVNCTNFQGTAAANVALYWLVIGV